MGSSLSDPGEGAAIIQAFQSFLAARCKPLRIAKAPRPCPVSLAYISQAAARTSNNIVRDTARSALLMTLAGLSFLHFFRGVRASLIYQSSCLSWNSGQST